MSLAVLIAVALLAFATMVAWLAVFYRSVQSRRRVPGREPRPVRAYHARVPRWRHPRVRWSIFERDGWRCHLCGGEVTQGVTHPEDQAQIDHVKPRSRGGGHDDGNLATSCQRCNLLKGNVEDNEAVRRAIAAWRAKTDPDTPWSDSMQADLELYRRLAQRPGFRGHMRRIGWSDGLVV